MKNINRVVYSVVTVIVLTLIACRQQVLPSESANPPQVDSSQPTISAETPAPATEPSLTDIPATENPAAEPDLSLWNQCAMATLSPDGSLLAVDCNTGIVIYDTISLRQIAEIPRNEGIVLDIAFSPDNKFITIAYTPDSLVYAVKQLDFINNVQTSDAEVHSDEDYSDQPKVILSSDGTTLALFKATAGILKIWDVTNAKELRTSNVYLMPGNFTFSPDGKTLVFTEIGLFSSKLILWDVVSGNKTEIHGDNATNNSQTVYNRRTAFSPDGKLLATATGYSYVLFEKYTVSISENASGNELISFDVPITPSMSGNPLLALTLNKDGSLLATGSATTITIWDTSTGQALQSIDYAVENNAYLGYDLLFVADDTKLISASEGNNQVILWDVTTGEQIAP